jgi:hypothetical protein
MSSGITNFPDYPCPACHSTDWWYNGTSWLCGRCHPADELVALKFRVIKGNEKLFKVYKQITAMGLGPERDKALAQYRPAIEKLKALAKELKDRGETACLYIEDGKKVRKCLCQEEEFFCHACPNDYWPDKELMELDRAKYPDDYK